MMQALTQLINFLAEIVVPVRGEAAAGEAAMGNAQRKFHSKGGGSKAEDGETQKQKEPTESRLKKGTAEKKSQKHLPDREGEVNGYLHSDQKSESPEAEKVSTSHGAGSQSAGGGRSTSLPPTAAKLKSEGNELFKSGQFGEAVLKYSEAIEYVIGLGGCNTLCLRIGLLFRLLKGTTDELAYLWIFGRSYCAVNS